MTDLLPPFYIPAWPEAPYVINALLIPTHHLLVAFGLPLLSPGRKYLSQEMKV